MSFLDHKNIVVRFFIYATLLYAAWFLLYELVLKTYTALDEKLIGLIIANAAAILNLFGLTTYKAVEEDDMQLLGIDGAHPVWIGAPCNAITLFAFFSLFILAFPGRIKHKLWFIPAGILLIHLANVIRVIALVFINYRSPEWLAFNHTYTFTVLVYGLIFAMWMWWVRFSLKAAKPDEQKT